MTVREERKPVVGRAEGVDGVDDQDVTMQPPALGASHSVLAMSNPDHGIPYHVDVVKA